MKMLSYVKLSALAAMLLLAVSTHASAGSCLDGVNCGCGPAIAVVEPCGPMVESYLVNQGPVLSGPGHYLRQGETAAPCCYPYVGFVFSGYPYGAYGPGGYPRGFYSPYIGYPYAEPYRSVLRYAYGSPRDYRPRAYALHGRRMHRSRGW